MKKYFIIMYVENGKEETIETFETIQTLKERLKCYKENNIEIVNVEEKIVVTQLINMKNQLKKWGF